ncbi:hypothetical protein, partial [Frankia sp. Cj3]|uniref:hypothetical protein n=1 Tax=Frankia sp. Cj3 TaxID=2880976 RepID=UPI001EF56770
ATNAGTVVGWPYGSAAIVAGNNGVFRAAASAIRRCYNHGHRRWSRITDGRRASVTWAARSTGGGHRGTSRHAHAVSGWRPWGWCGALDATSCRPTPQYPYARTR